MKPTVSIIIPCYNKRAYVAKTIESALAQSYPCEIIVVDDGSTDGSLDEIKRFDGQIRWTSGENQGGCAARNTGVAMSSGDYLQFLDADDILPVEKVAMQMDALRGEKLDSIAVCPWQFLNDDGSIEPPKVRSYWHSHDRGIELLLDMWHQGGFFPTHPWLVSRSLALKIGTWNEDLNADQDGEYFGRTLTRAGSVKFCTDTSVYYRSPPEGAVSRDKSHLAGQSRFQAFEVVANEILSYRDDRYAHRACLSRLRKTVYALREHSDILVQATGWEQRLNTFDFSPSLPFLARCLIAFFGVERGLYIRSLLKS